MFSCLPCYPAVCPGSARCGMPAQAAPAPAAKVEKSCGCNSGCGMGALIPLFILVGLLALFLPGGFFFILLLILLLILTCCCGACR